MAAPDEDTKLAYIPEVILKKRKSKDNNEALANLRKNQLQLGKVSALAKKRKAGEVIKRPEDFVLEFHAKGSAADIIKIAMINVYSVIVEGVDQLDSCSSILTKFHMLKGHCRILLQVHDELVLEVDPSVMNEAVLLLQQSMEGAALLLVPLHAKLKVGRTWGSLEPYEPVDVTVHGA